MGFGYSMFRRNRNRHGGGVAILLSSHIPHGLHSDLSEGHVESVWVGLYPCSKQSLATSMLCIQATF